MNEIISLGFFSIIIGLIVLANFFYLVYDVSKIKKRLRMIYSCKHCGFKSEKSFDFCPVCEKNRNGLTLEELKEIYHKATKQTI